MSQKLRKAVFTVLEGWTLPDDARKILEAAYYNDFDDEDGASSICPCGEDGGTSCGIPNCFLLNDKSLD